MTIVNSFTIPVKYDIIVDANKHLKEVNEQLAKVPGIFASLGAEKGLQFDVLYTACRNTETGDFRVEGKPILDNARLDIISVEVKNVSLTDPVYSGVQTTHPRDIPLYSIDECVNKVKGWSKERGILENGVWYTQGTKLYEEDGEAATGVGKNKHPLIMDGVGDAIVVLVNLMELTGYDAVNIPRLLGEARLTSGTTIHGNAHRLFHKMRYSITCAIDLLWDMAGVDSPKKLNFDTFDNGTKESVEFYFEEMLVYADSLANAYDMTLEQCFSLAWDEIKDRKGFLNADGIFVKEADMTAEQKAAQGSL